MGKINKEKYISEGGVNCPYCGNSDIEGSNFDFYNGTIRQEMSCLKCKKEWEDLFKLIDVFPIS